MTYLLKYIERDDVFALAAINVEHKDQIVEVLKDQGYTQEFAESLVRDWRFIIKPCHISFCLSQIDVWDIKDVKK